MNEFHFFFETFLKLNNFKIFEMEKNENASVCFFARMPEVFSLLERRNGESRSGEKNRFAVNLLSPKNSKKPLEFRETRNPAFQEDLSVVDNENILVNRGRAGEIFPIFLARPCHANTLLLVKRFCPRL